MSIKDNGYLPDKITKILTGIWIAFIIFFFFVISADISLSGTPQYFNVDIIGSYLEDLALSPDRTGETQSITPVQGQDIAFPEKFERVAFNRSTNISGRWNFSVHFMSGSSRSVTGAPYANIYKYEDRAETLIYNGSADKPSDKTFSNSSTEFNWSQDLSDVVIDANARIRVQIVFSVTNLASGFSGIVKMKYADVTYNSPAEITSGSPADGVLSTTFNNEAPVGAKIGEKKVRMVNYALSSSTAGHVDIETDTAGQTGKPADHSIKFVNLIRDANSKNEAPTEGGEDGRTRR